MARLQDPESQRRYAGYMKRFVCYCLRVVAVSDGDAGSRSSRQGGRIDSDADESDDEQQSGENNQDPMRDARELSLAWEPETSRSRPASPRPIWIRRESADRQGD